MHRKKSLLEDISLARSWGQQGGVLGGVEDSLVASLLLWNRSDLAE